MKPYELTILGCLYARLELRRAAMRILWALLLCVGISPLARSQEVLDSIVSDSFHLVGLHVVRHKSIGVTKQRILVRGVRLPNGHCSYQTRGPRVAGWSQWEEEVDYDTCTAIHAQGPGDGGPHVDPNRGHLVVVPFKPRADTVDTQAVQKKKEAVVSETCSTASVGPVSRTP